MRSSLHYFTALLPSLDPPPAAPAVPPTGSAGTGQRRSGEGECGRGVSGDGGVPALPPCYDYSGRELLVECCPRAAGVRVAGSRGALGPVRAGYLLRGREREPRRCEASMLLCWHWLD